MHNGRERAKGAEQEWRQEILSGSLGQREMVRERKKRKIMDAFATRAKRKSIGEREGGRK